MTHQGHTTRYCARLFSEGGRARTQGYLRRRSKRLLGAFAACPTFIRVGSTSILYALSTT